VELRGDADSPSIGSPLLRCHGVRLRGEVAHRPATRADLADSTVIGADKFARDAVLSVREFFSIS